MTTTLLPPNLSQKLLADRDFRQMSEGSDVCFALAVRGGRTVGVHVKDGVVTDSRSAEFCVELEHSDWSRVLAADVAPQQQHVLAFLEPRGTGTVRGDKTSFAQHLHLVRRAVEVMAKRPTAAPGRTGGLSHIAGSYVAVDVPNWGPCDIYIETAGHGRPILLLHTAGSDSRQFHGLLTDRALTAHNRLISFDLPWHGRSGPARGARPFDYTLSTQTYTDCITGLIDALALPQPPVAVGSSMAGAAVLEVAAYHPDKLAGVISCQAGPRVSHRQTPWLRHARVNQTLHVPEWTYGLMSPLSPVEHRDHLWWGYSQGGWGIYERDIAYYTQWWDIDNIVSLFGPHTPPIVIMNGQYDYSVPPKASQELAALIPGARYRAMPELGHFPHAENPAVFAHHLAWALDEIDRQGKGRRP